MPGNTSRYTLVRIATGAQPTLAGKATGSPRNKEERAAKSAKTYLRWHLLVVDALLAIGIKGLIKLRLDRASRRAGVSGTPGVQIWSLFVILGDGEVKEEACDHY